MKDLLKRFLKNLITEDDGESFCIAKIMAAMAFFSFIGYAIFGLIHGHFALQEFASGLMQVLAGSGAVIMGKQMTQKDTKQQ